MDTAGLNSLVPEDDLQEELQAALVEIEKMPGGSSAAVATLEDEREETDAPSPEDRSTQLQPASAAGESTEAANVSSAEVEALATSASDTDPGEPAASINEGSSLPTESGGDEPAGAAGEPSADGEANDRAPMLEDTPPTPSVADGDAPAGESRLLPDGELAAELTKITQMSREEAAAIPSLDDGSEDEEDPAALDDQGAAAEREPAPDSDTQLGDEELAATLTEAQKLLTDPKADVSPPGAAEADAPGESTKAEGAPSSGSTPTVGDGSRDEAAPRPARKKLRFQIGKEPVTKEGVAEYRPPDERGDTARVVQPAASLGKRLYRAVDGGLDTVNRPFEQMGERTRALVGYAAATTLAVSILAMILMPLLMPHRDAIVFLQEKRAALDAPPPAEEVDEADRGDEPSP